MVVYVDDMLLFAKPSDTSLIWRSLEKQVSFKERECEIARYLGAGYVFSAFDRNHNATRSVHTDMDDYVTNAIAKFIQEYGKKVKKESSPYLTTKSDADWLGGPEDKKSTSGMFSGDIQSFVGASLAHKLVGAETRCNLFQHS